MNTRGQGSRAYSGINRKARPRSVTFARAVLIAVVLSVAQMIAVPTIIAATAQQAQPVASVVPTVTIEGYDVDFTLPSNCTAMPARCFKAMSAKSKRSGLSEERRFLCQRFSNRLSVPPRRDRIITCKPVVARLITTGRCG